LRGIAAIDCLSSRCRSVSNSPRQGFATQLLQQAYDIRTVQELLGHKDVKITMVYIHKC
jgi:site-specific recombinase XerD